MASTTRGPSPNEYGRQKKAALVGVLNTVTTGLYGAVVKSMPVGVGGRLQRSWVLTPANVQKPVASIGTNSGYFLPLEMGRKPGSGISAEGQDSVTLWARRKLSLSEQEARGLAFNLSQKYKREGRPATGLIGLAAPGSMAAPVPATLDNAIPGSLLANAVTQLQAEIDRL